MMKSLGDFPQVKIPGKEIVLWRRHIVAPVEGRLPLGERKGHGTLPSWSASFSSLLTLRIDSRNGRQSPTQPVSRAAIGGVRSALRLVSGPDILPGITGGRQWATHLRNEQSRITGSVSTSGGWPGSRFWGSTATATSSGRSLDAWRRTGRTPRDFGQWSTRRFPASHPGRAAFSRHFAARL